MRSDGFMTDSAKEISQGRGMFNTLKWIQAQPEKGYTGILWNLLF